MYEQHLEHDEDLFSLLQQGYQLLNDEDLAIEKVHGSFTKPIVGDHGGSSKIEDGARANLFSILEDGYYFFMKTY